MRSENTAAVAVDQPIQDYVTHLREIAGVFNRHARKIGLGIRLDARRAIDSARKGVGFARVMRFRDRTDDSGVLHEAQLMTAQDCIARLLGVDGG